NQTSLTTSSSISDFPVLKAFRVRTHPPKANKIIEVLWHPPLLGWVKCNTDGAAHGSPSPSACGGLFRNCHGVHLGSFVDFLGNSNAFAAELSGVMCAI
ncbi:ribonuclease H protein, partial [Trifolium medium]|nr:ribonuclease H protein [Trifolium medium]